MHFIDYILLGLGIIFNFFIPGYVFVELFLPKLENYVKISLYLIFSYLLSTNFIYILALIFGLNNFVIFFTYFVWIIIFLIIKKNKFEFNNLWPVIIVSLLVFIIYVISLYPAIFAKHNGYYVMSADNWQDTALHLSIIESLKNGNFPPNAPYFSGRNLNYHYFTDLHTSLITFPLNKFTPRFLIFDNSFFATIFLLANYSLIFYLTKNKLVSIITSISLSFAGGTMFIKFLSDYFNGQGGIKSLILTGKYVLEYGGLYQMTPLTNYFLQNRPMMAGLPILTIGILLIIKKKYLLTIFLMLLGIKFQLFTSVLIFLILIINLILERNKYIFVIIGSSILVVLYFKDSLSLIIDNFKFESWVVGENYFWYFKFLLFNFGVYFVCFVLLFILLLSKKIKTSRNIFLLICSSLLMIAIPFVCTFTIDKYDMLKFFYISFVPLGVLASYIFNSFSKRIFLGLFIVLFLIFATGSGFIDLAGSYLNKNLGYSKNDLATGEWILKNTPQKSVFITYPSVHSPVTDIAGRLRVMSYSQWPYTHGYNVGIDNVFSRQEDIFMFYEKGDMEILKKYGVNYVYFGNDELANFPTSKNNIESNIDLILVYENENTKIYRKN